MDEGSVPEGDHQPQLPEHPAPEANLAALKPFSDARSVLDSLRETPAFTRTDTDARAVVSEIHALKATLDALALDLIADLDTRPEAIPQSRPDHVARTFLRSALHRTPNEAKFDVDCAHRLRIDADPLDGGLPMMARALAAGAISRDHANVGVRTMNRLSKEQLARPTPRWVLDGREAAPETHPTDGDGEVPGDGGPGDEEARVPAGYVIDAFLTEKAKEFNSADLKRIARHLLNVLDPDDNDGFDPNAVDRRHVTATRDAETGMIIGRFQLDAENGAWFQTALDHFTHRPGPRPETTADGEDTITPPERTRGQLAADALGEICRLAMASESAGTGPGGERPHIIVTTGHDTLDDALDDPLDDAGDGNERNHDGHETMPDETRTPCHRPTPNGMQTANARTSPDRRTTHVEHLGLIGQQLLRRLACDSILQAAVLGPSGEVLNLGRQVRTISRAQRRALHARDRGCVMPGCTAPARRCEGHHVRHWRHGGATDIRNLALLCASCHTAVHLGGWELVMLDGMPWARPPDYVDPLRRLIRNTLYDSLDEATHLGLQMRLPLPPNPPPPPVIDLDPPPPKDDR